MTTCETAQFIQDRALSLRYEGIHFHTTKSTALAWLENAFTWARRHGHTQLAATLNARTREIQNGHPAETKTRRQRAQAKYQLALPTREQTAETETAIMAKQFARIALCLVEDGCGDDLRRLLDVLHMIDWTQTSRHILAGAVTAMQANQRESEEDIKRFSRLTDEVFRLREEHGFFA